MKVKKKKTSFYIFGYLLGLSIEFDNFFNSTFFRYWATKNFPKTLNCCLLVKIRPQKNAVMNLPLFVHHFLLELFFLCCLLGLISICFFSLIPFLFLSCSLVLSPSFRRLLLNWDFLFLFFFFLVLPPLLLLLFSSSSSVVAVF